MADTSIVKGGGGASLPTTPASALLNAGAPSTFVLLDGSGAGTQVPPETAADLAVGAYTDSAAAGDFVVGDGAGGTTLASAAAAAARTVIAATPGATIVDPLTGAGWTATEPAGASATWSAGTSLTLSGTAGTSTAAAVTRPSVLDAGAQSWELVVRLQMTAGYNSGLSFGQSGYLLTMARLSATNYVALMFYSNGVIAAYVNINGSFTNSGALSPAPTQSQATGGQLWWKLRGDTSGRWVVSWGVGTAGALPGAWQRVYVIDSAAITAAAMATAPWYLEFGTESSRAQLTTIVVHAIRSTWSGTL